MLNGWLTYFTTKEEKPVCINEAGLNLGRLKEYIIEKYAVNTPVEIGKYRLALYLENDVKQRVKDKDINYNDMQRNFYVAYKVNEFLDRSDTYASLPDPPKSIFEESHTMQELLNESKVLGLEMYSEKEMETLFRLFEKMLYSVSLPAALPEHVKKYYFSGLLTSYSRLHYIIKDLFEQCQKKVLELEKTKTEPQPSVSVATHS